MQVHRNGCASAQRCSCSPWAQPRAVAATTAATATAAAASEAEATGGTFSLYIGEPENPLIPSNTSETEGGQVVDAIC